MIFFDNNIKLWLLIININIYFYNILLFKIDNQIFSLNFQDNFIYYKINIDMMLNMPIIVQD